MHVIHKHILNSFRWKSLIARYKIFVLSTVCSKNWNHFTASRWKGFIFLMNSWKQFPPISHATMLRVRTSWRPEKQFAQFSPSLEILKPELPFEWNLYSPGNKFFFFVFFIYFLRVQCSKGSLILLPKNQRNQRASLHTRYTNTQTITLILKC